MTTTTTVLRKKRVSPSLLRNHLGKLCAASLFLVLLCVGKVDDLTGFITGTEKAWSASTVGAMAKAKTNQKSSTNIDSVLSGMQQGWSLFRGAMDLVLGDGSSAPEIYPDDKLLERVIQETGLSDAAFRVKAEELRRRMENGEMDEKDLLELLAPLVKDDARPTLPKSESR